MLTIIHLLSFYYIIHSSIFYNSVFNLIFSIHLTIHLFIYTKMLYISIKLLVMVLNTHFFHIFASKLVIENKVSKETILLTKKICDYAILLI